VSERPFETARLDEIKGIGSGGGWKPIRRRLGIRSFGVNAYIPEGDDGEIIGEHDEQTTRHEELYVVISGRAAFTVDGDRIDAPMGTIVFVRDPAVKRRAVAVDADTTILAIGATPGVPFSPSAWEENADILPLFESGDYQEAKERLERVLERDPDDAGMVYNLACAEARLGEAEAALEHLRRAIERQERLRDLAQNDPDLESIRTDPRFPAPAASN
jgi:quercetin dioxygenase-like cupin family protein